MSHSSKQESSERRLELSDQAGGFGGTFLKNKGFVSNFNPVQEYSASLVLRDFKSMPEIDIDKSVVFQKRKPVRAFGSTPLVEETPGGAPPLKEPIPQDTPIQKLKESHAEREALTRYMANVDLRNQQPPYETHEKARYGIPGGDLERSAPYTSRRSQSADLQLGAETKEILQKI